MKSKLSILNSQIKGVNGNCQEIQQHGALCNVRYIQRQKHRKSLQRGTEFSVQTVENRVMGPLLWLFLKRQKYKKESSFIRNKLQEIILLYVHIYQ